MTRHQNIKIEIMFCGLVIFIKILISSASKALNIQNNNVLQRGHHDQNFNPIKSRGLWRPISISHLFSKGRILDCSFLHLGCFWFRFHFLESFTKIQSAYQVVVVYANIFMFGYIFTTVFLQFPKHKKVFNAVQSYCIEITMNYSCSNDYSPFFQIYSDLKILCTVYKVGF